MAVKNKKKKYKKQTKKNSKIQVNTQVKVEKTETKEEKTEVKEENIPNRSKKYTSLFISIIIIFLTILLVLYFPRIILKGESETILSYKDIYNEPGYNGYTLNKDITEKIEIDNNINTGVIGDYQVKYYINLLGAKVIKTRNIKIVDNISPTITTDKEVVKICPQDAIPDIEYRAIDEYEGDITNKVKKTIKDNQVLLEVADSSLNKAALTINIDRIDHEKPIIKLKGSSVIYLTYGNLYQEPGYTASDNCDNDITDKVVVTGNVKRDIGTYELTYKVTDRSNNETTINRKIIISPAYRDYGSINKGAIYLTFDDGPRQGITDKILDVLKEEGVKATFFVTCNGPDYLIKRIHDEGHTIALHTATHNYSYVYSSIDNYYNDLNQVSDRVKRITGIDSKIIRFPGGSSNTISRNYSHGIMTQLTISVLQKGYRYYDWNIDSMDASTARNSNDVYYNVTSRLSPSNSNMVLMHDTNNITANAIKDIIRFGKNYGYSFKAIDMNTYMVRHPIKN